MSCDNPKHHCSACSHENWQAERDAEKIRVTEKPRYFVYSSFLHIKYEHVVEAFSEKEADEKLARWFKDNPDGYGRFVRREEEDETGMEVFDSLEDFGDPDSEVIR